MRTVSYPEGGTEDHQI